MMISEQTVEMELYKPPIRLPTHILHYHNLVIQAKKTYLNFHQLVHHYLEELFLPLNTVSI